MLQRTIFLLAALALSGCGKGGPGDNAGLAAKQAQVEQRGKSVMSFDIDRTMHHFRKLPSGGVQEVVSSDGDPRQIALIRQHLKSEADRFRSGDFSDPGSIHGPEMPGLSTLSAGAGNIDIRYSEIPEGARISYGSADPRLVAAIHSWFDAQVREHGHHAMAAR
ncbi:MAG TPA: hypothetical protein VE820_05920 [Sphingomicrobium sp.]|nr:hypothetical protein [Sphingomicrobium sp.]